MRKVSDISACTANYKAGHSRGIRRQSGPDFPAHLVKSVVIKIFIFLPQGEGKLRPSAELLPMTTVSTEAGVRATMHRVVEIWLYPEFLDPFQDTAKRKHIMFPREDQNRIIENFPTLGGLQESPSGSLRWVIDYRICMNRTSNLDGYKGGTTICVQEFTPDSENPRFMFGNVIC